MAVVPYRSKERRDRRLIAVAMTHQTEYALGAIATIVIAIRLRELSRRSISTAAPKLVNSG